jgi:hypothetical protein
MEKIRIGTQVIKQAQIESEIRSVIPEINGSLRFAIGEIGFEPSEEIFKDCLDGGREITQQNHVRLNKELSIMSIPSSRTLFGKSANEGLKKFHTTRIKVVDRCGADARKYITFRNGNAEFTEEDKKQLFEDCGIYLINPDEIELYNLHQKACEALNNLFQSYASLVWNQMFDFDKNKQFIPEPRTNYDTLFSNIQKAKQ